MGMACAAGRRSRDAPSPAKTSVTIAVVTAAAQMARTT
jgi:hypothetical protein